MPRHSKADRNARALTQNSTGMPGNSHKQNVVVQNRTRLPVQGYEKEQECAGAHNSEKTLRGTDTKWKCQYHGTKSGRI